MSFNYDTKNVTTGSTIQYGRDQFGNVHQISTDISGSLMITLDSPYDAFGSPVFTEVHPVTHQHFTYGVQPRTTVTLTSPGSQAVAAGSLGNGSDLVISTDNATGSYSIARSFKAIHYRAGVGQIARFTVAFNVGVANTKQFAGLWSAEAGYMIGYNGTSWGCFARTGGTQEIRKLTVTTAATTIGNCTVTIDGHATVVALTSQTNNPSRTAWEIARADYTNVGGNGTWGWEAYALGADVYFIARRARINSGTFSFSAGTTGAVTTFTTVRAGVNEVDDFGSPEVPGNWTFIDPLDGSGPSRIQINKQKSAIYSIDTGHLGHRGARAFVLNRVTGKFFEFARYDYMNKSTVNAMQNPSVNVGWGIYSNGATTPMTMSVGSGMGGNEGIIDPDEGERFALSSSKVPSSGVETHFLSVRNGPVVGFNQAVRASRIEQRALEITISVPDGPANAYVDAKIVRNAVMTNSASFVTLDATRLGTWAWVDTISTANTTSSGTLLDSARVGSSGVIELPDNIIIGPGETLSVICTPSAGSMNVHVNLHGIEVQ